MRRSVAWRNILDQLKLLEICITLPLALHHSFLVIALQTLNFTRLSNLIIVILKSFTNTKFVLVWLWHSWRRLSSLMLNAILIILSSDSESLSLISLYMLTHILSMSWALKGRRLVTKHLLCFLSFCPWMVEIIMLRTLFIISNFLISMLSLGSRARYTPMRFSILLLFTFTICFLWVNLIKIAVGLITIIECTLGLKPWSQMMLLYLWNFRICHQFLN